MPILVKLIGVNKGTHVTLKYFSILIKFSRKHRLFIGPGQSLIGMASNYYFSHQLNLPSFPKGEMKEKN